MTKAEAYRLRGKVFDALQAGSDIEPIIKEAQRHHSSRVVNRAVGIVIKAVERRQNEAIRNGNI